MKQFAVVVTALALILIGSVMLTGCEEETVCPDIPFEWVCPDPLNADICQTSDCTVKVYIEDAQANGWFVCVTEGMYIGLHNDDPNHPAYPVGGVCQDRYEIPSDGYVTFPSDVCDNFPWVIDNSLRGRY